MKKNKILKDADQLVVRMTVNKELDKLSGKVLFPEKLEQANKILSQIKFVNLK